MKSLGVGRKKVLFTSVGKCAPHGSPSTAN